MYKAKETWQQTQLFNVVPLTPSTYACATSQYGSLVLRRLRESTALQAQLCANWRWHGRSMEKTVATMLTYCSIQDCLMDNSIASAERYGQKAQRQ